MKKIVITALSVVFFTAAFAQEKKVEVKSKATSEMEAKTEKGHTKLSENATMDARAEAGQERAELQGENASEIGLTKSVLKGENRSEKSALQGNENSEVEGEGVVVNEVATDGLNMANDHGETVSNLAKSIDDISIKGETISDVASSNAVGVNMSSVKPDVKAGVKTSTNVKANVKVKPIKVNPKVRVKSNLGVKL